MIHLYEIWNTAYDKNGDVILTPTGGKVKQVAGGGYDLEMTCALDHDGKWKKIVPGCIVRVPVPKETIDNAFVGTAADIYKTNTETVLREGPSEPTLITYTAWQANNATYIVNDKVTYNGKNYICILGPQKSEMGYNYPPDNYPQWWRQIARYTSGAAVLLTLPVGADLYFVEDYDANWYKMSTYYGLEGYIKKTDVTFYQHVDPTDIKPRIITDQLFRLREPVVNTENQTLTVTGQHVSYDLAGILIKDVSISQAVPAMAIGRITDAFMMDYNGIIATNITDDTNGTYTGQIKGKNGIYALLDPDKGIVQTFGAKLTRDNWDFFIMTKQDNDPVLTMAYGKNVRGITWKRSSANIVTRVVPVAKDADGDDLYLPEKWVDSSLISNYPVIMMEQISVQGQVGKTKSDADDSVWTEAALLNEMRAKAAERFSVDKADQVKVEVTVQFEPLGSTVEFEWLKALENVLLYDKVVVLDAMKGISVTVTVTELEYDIVAEKITGLKLSNVEGIDGRSVTGYNVANRSIGSEKLMDTAVADIVAQAVDKTIEAVPTANMTNITPVVNMNTKDTDGIVEKGSGNASKVWGTDAQGNPGWQANGNIGVTDGDPTLAWGTRSKVGTVAGTDLHVTMPANPASASDNDPTLAWGTRSKVGTANGVDLHVTMPENPAPEVVDGLNSTSATKALSANQGRVLKELFENSQAGTGGFTQFIANQISGTRYQLEALYPVTTP